MSSFKKNCPVPFNQQPLNQYLELKESWLFSWSINKIKEYLLKILIIFLSLFFFWFCSTYFFYSSHEYI